MKRALLGMTLTELQDVAQELGQPKYRAQQIAEWLYQKGAASFEEMTNLSKAMREQLSERYEVGRHAPAVTQVSKDGTEKYLFPLHANPNLKYETVYIPDGKRATLCVSSQVGCKMNCSFCATGKMGFQTQLSATDIINQMLSVPHSDLLTNVVFMGMGEPLDNYEEVARALEIMTASYGFAWSPRRITVSTIAPKRGLLRLLEEQEVHVAVSLHSPFSEERLSLMPVEQAFPIEEVLDTLGRYDFSGQRRLSFEYILLDGVNDSPRHAEALVRLLKPLDCRVNLIPYHAIPDIPLRPSPKEQIERFEEYLTSRGIRATTRRSRGQDIFAACGMLSTIQGK
ncbi:MAG: 23S rRNA (adenine(2503)-C(2))-methyltransferase RlmN [Porphyromonas sp.]|nr:23S rRNA (adenine(2503)-C(2))-methyltransferase RlmN [Porphyromonas sp.]